MTSAYHYKQKNWEGKSLYLPKENIYYVQVTVTQAESIILFYKNAVFHY